MEQKKVFKPDKEILRQIQLDNETINLSVINRLRVAGRVEYLPYLITLARTTSYETVGSAVFKLLDDLKVKKAVPYLIEAIRDEKDKAILQKLVEACWQNGLSYEQYLPVFTDLLIHESDEISLEAFTVIENMQYKPDTLIVSKEIEKIRKYLPGAEERRKYFLNEAIKILYEIPE